MTAIVRRFQPPFSLCSLLPQSYLTPAGAAQERLFPRIDGRQLVPSSNALPPAHRSQAFRNALGGEKYRYGAESFVLHRPAAGHLNADGQGLTRKEIH